MRGWRARARFLALVVLPGSEAGGRLGREAFEFFRGSMPNRCAECGAPISQGGSCREHLHALLASEWQIPGGPGALPHFYAVASFGLQHPRTMNYSPESVAGLRQAVADALANRAGIDQLRARASAGAMDRGRVTRREGDAVVEWELREWPITIADVLPSITNQATYAARVMEWARSVVEQLDRLHPAS